MTVHILATCRSEKFVKGTTLVFDTLRVGFPTHDIKVYLNSPLHCRDQILAGCEKVGASTEEVTTIHHDWIKILLDGAVDPFWICDTDMIFWDSFEQWDFSGHALAGRRIPEWRDEFTRARTRARLHTSLLYFDPKLILERAVAYASQFPKTPFNPIVDLISPMVTPFKGGAYFYDTTALLYHAIGGTPFTDKQLDCYDHMNFGTIPDVVLPHLSNGPEMALAREEIYKNPIQAKGLWRAQEKYYQSLQ